MLYRGFDQKTLLNEPAERNCQTRLIFGKNRHETTKKPTISIGSFALFLAVPTGLGFATRNYLGAQ